MATPIRDRIELYAMRELHLFFLKELMEFALPLLLPSRLALFNLGDPALGREVFELYSNVCTLKDPTASIPYRRQGAGVIRNASSREFSGRDC